MGEGPIDSDDRYTQAYVYQGNPSAEPASDGDATFPFFDDFIGYSVDSVKWKSYIDMGASITVSNEVDIFTSGSGSGNQYSALESKTMFSISGTLVALYRPHDT